MTIIVFFALGYIIGRLAHARQYSKMALPVSAPVVELPENMTADPVVVVKSPVMEKPTMPAQKPQEATEQAEPEKADTHHGQGSRQSRQGSP